MTEKLEIMVNSSGRPIAPLTEFDKTKENIGRQYSVAYPLRTVYPETQREKIALEVKINERKFFEQGVTGVVESQEDVQLLATTLARLKYGADHTLFHDLGVNIHTALTRPNDKTSFYDVRYLRDDATGKIEKTAVTISLEGITKLTLGPLVNDKGRAITGAGPVVKEQKKRLHELLYGHRAEPVAGASFNITKDKKIKKGVIYGKPIIIDKFTKDAFVILLDNTFFPVMENDKKNKIKELYLHHVAGLSSVIAFGRYLLRQEKKGSYPQTPEVHKALLYLQAASEMQKFAPSIIRSQGNGRYNFVFRRGSTISELRPEAKRSDGYIDYREFSNFISNVGRIYATALTKLDIFDHLHERTLVPSIEKGAEFPDNINKDVVYIKADEIRKIKSAIK